MSRARRTTYLMSKAFHRCHPEVCAKIFTTCDRPILEFSGPVWSPHLVRDAEALERVQRWATRIPYGQSRPTYPDRLRQLGIQSFAERRLRGDLIVTYRATHQILYGLDTLDTFSLNLNHLRGHQYKLRKQMFRTTARQQFLPNRVFDVWNNLPISVVEAPSVNAFKSRYDSWCNQRSNI